MTWYCIRTSPQRELALAGRYDDKGEWVKGILERKGFTVFCPIESKMRRTIKRGRRTTRQVFYPMFVRYIFADVSLVELHFLLEENHVSGVIGFDGGPAPIPEHEIRKLMAISGKAIPHRKSVNPHKALRPGETAEIVWGAYEGQIVTIKGLKGRKARILAKMFGVEREMEIDTDQLEAA